MSVPVRPLVFISENAKYIMIMFDIVKNASKLEVEWFCFVLFQYEDQLEFYKYRNGLSHRISHWHLKLLFQLSFDIVNI